MPEAAKAYISSPAQPAWGLSPRAAGFIALLDGAATLSFVALGSTSWMLTGSSLVVWIICGWSIYFRPKPTHPRIAALGTVLLVSAGIAAAAVLSRLYLLVLGPSWIL